MHGREAVLLVGNTCAGKSSVGKRAFQRRGVVYLSFGDLKRVEIATHSLIGIDLDERIRAARPIDPEMGARVLDRAFGGHVRALVSGFPISEDEASEFTRTCRCAIRGAVVLDIGIDALRARYFNRGTCPRCQTPGLVGTPCPVHGIELVARPDASETELAVRLRLYENRIEPFTQSPFMQSVPIMRLCVDQLSQDAVYTTVEEFLDAIFGGP